MLRHISDDVVRFPIRQRPSEKVSREDESKVIGPIHETCNAHFS
jgi:hypothetical protein